MADSSDLEKTESPSPRRLEQAREEGNAPHSKELGTFVVLFTAVAGIALMGPQWSEACRTLIRQGLRFDEASLSDPAAMMSSLWVAAYHVSLSLGPWLLAVFVLGVVAPLTLSGFLFSSKKFMPDFSRLSPARGLGNMVSSTATIELIKAIVKAFIVGGLALYFLWTREGSVMELASLDVSSRFIEGANLIQQALFLMVGALAIVVFIDVPYQLWRFYNELKMTREELKQEARETDGDPQLKARIRSQQRAMARRRMMSEVPKADFVVTNPRHYAVALRYDGASMRAPKVVAKGQDLIALNIRILAEKHHIPILEQPPLARALFRYADLDVDIPPLLYSAVAEVLAYVYQLKAYESGEGGLPGIPGTVEVPPSMYLPGEDEAEGDRAFYPASAESVIEGIGR